MRPRALAMTAFGPYAGTERIDFGNLGESALFLVNGPTGAGKTTILDAMCFALFGRTSGADRDGRQMRSDYVDPSVTTEVVFDFVLGSEVFQVRRSPEQEVMKRRGAGTTKLPAAATLWRRTGLSDSGDEGVVAASRWERVTEAVEGLLGFKYEQFRQVVLLPQGEFRRLLLAKSNEREDILAILFQTEAYRRVEEYFKQVAKGVEEAAREVGRRQEWLLQEAGVPTTGELVVRLAGDAAGCLAAAVKTGAARQALQQAQETLNACRRQRELFAERERVRESLATLEAQAAAMEERRSEATAARRAGALATAAEAVDTRREEWTAASRQLAAVAAELAKARSDRTAAEAAYAGEKDREAERQAAERSVLQLTEMRERCVGLDVARRAWTEAEAKAVTAGELHERARAERDQLMASIVELRAERDRLLPEAASAEGRATAANEAAKLLEACLQLDALRTEWQTAAKNHAEAEAESVRLEGLLAEARGEYEELEVRWRSGQAAYIAATLVPGEPCPVCGAPEHPTPAAAVAGAPDAAALDAGRTALRKLESQLELKRRELTDAAYGLGEVRARGTSLRQQIGEQAGAGVPALRQAAAAAAAALRAAQAAAGVLAAGEARAAELGSRLPVLEKSAADAETAAGEARAAARAARAVLTEREKTVPDELRAPGAQEAALTEAVRRRDQLLQSLERARAAAEEAVRLAQGLAATEAAARRTVSDAAARLEAEEALLSGRLLAAGFAGEAEFTAARRPEEIIREMEAAVTGYETALAVARDRVARAEEATEGLEAPDVGSAEAAAAAAQSAYDGAVAEQTRLEEGVNKQRGWLDQLKALEAEQAGREAEYAVVGKLAQIANGQNTRRVSFHRFVLQALLDDVMAAANTRLKKMSRGRYALRRMADPLHRGMAGGLDIEIEDGYTGYCRHVATLSGGETFLASLALALGLADVVQSYSGGIFLDTIFVDEGFGTLDPESLDMAMQALVELRTRGRLVGIISHVPELKERIPARLEIVPTDRGSTTRWSI